MRLAIRIALVLGVLLVVALGALVVALPRIASSDAVRARIEEAAARASGEEVRFAELSFGLVPPRLVVVEPRLGPEAEALARAERIDLQLSLLPLLARAVVVDSLVVEGATLRLVRTRDGVALAGRRPAAPGKQPAGPAAAPDAEAGGGGFSLAVASLALRDSRLVVEDRTVSPPVTWDFQELTARARGHSLEEPLDIDATARLASGGRFTVRGTAGLDGALDLSVGLEGVALAPVAAYAGPGTRVAGAVSGDLRARGPDAERVSLLADLVVDEADLSVEDLLFQGRLALKADLAASQAGPSGPVEIDATAARVRYGEFFEKPPGTEATARGRVVSEADGNLAIRDMHLKIKNFQAEGRLESGTRTLIELDAPPFALDGWGGLVPPLAAYAPTGSLSLEKLALVPAPLSVRGRVGIQGLRVRLDEHPIGFDGALMAGGDRIDGQDLVARVGGTAIPLQLALTSLAGAPRYRVQAEVVDAEAGELLAALGGKPGLLSGPLTASADLAAPLDAAEPLRALAGRTRLEIGRGRLQGVSLLRGTVDRLGSLGEAALLAGARFGGRDLQRFYEDAFESITGTFAVTDGSARTDDLRLVYRDYSVDLRGALGLIDGSLDFTGKLSISQEVDAALTGAEAAAAPKVIPLARVRGTVESPRVELTREAVLALAARGVTEERRGEVEKKIDERLGEGAGREVMDALEGLLGRGRQN